MYWFLCLQREQRSTRISLGHWVWLKTPSCRSTLWLICTRKSVDFETSTTKWSQRRWAKSKMVECSAGKTWHRAGDGCCMTGRSTGELLLADSKVTWRDQTFKLPLNVTLIVVQGWSLKMKLLLLSDILAVLLSDVLLLLQEKDQRYVFAAVVCDLTLWKTKLSHCQWNIPQSQFLVSPVNLFTSSPSNHSSYFLPRTTNRRWSHFRSWLSGKWRTRRELCFSSVPPPMSQKCTRSTPAPRRSETAGWHTFDKLLRGAWFQPKMGGNNHFILLLFHICGIALPEKKDDSYKFNSLCNT